MAEIMATFSQVNEYQLLFESSYPQVLMWLDMARYSKHGTAIPDRYKSHELPDSLPRMKKSDEFRDTHIHTKTGWIKKKDVVNG